MSTLKKKSEGEQESAEVVTDANAIEEALKDTVPAMSAATSPKAAAPDPWEVMSRVASALEALVARPAAEQDTKAIETLTQAVMRMADSNITAAQMTVEESKKANRPSNQVVPLVSVFNRRGVLLEDYQKPKLKCLMMIPWLAEWDSLTREEVELLNLLEAGTYTVLRTDRSKISLDVNVRFKSDQVTPSELLIIHDTAHNNDNFRLMPPLSDMLRMMLKQHDREIAAQAAAILTDEEEEALIEAGELSVSQ